MIEITLPCHADYKYFPFDTLECAVAVGSPSSTNFVNLTFPIKQPIIVQKDTIKLSSFNIEVSDVKRVTSIIGLDLSQAQVHSASIYLKRYLGYYTLQLLLPSLLITILPWFSFSFGTNGPRVELCK